MRGAGPWALPSLRCNPLDVWRLPPMFGAPPVRSSPTLCSFDGFGVRSTTLSHGAPHSGQTPFADVPARMQGSMSLGGKTAKCAPGYGAVGIVQTERLLREVPTGRSAMYRWKSGLLRVPLPVASVLYATTAVSGPVPARPRECVFGEPVSLIAS